jgi:Na+-translocating ferredoxin:NAD+ oxidoreductase RNF subunit RnfB
MLTLLTDISEGRGKEGDIELLEEISETLIGSALCALGKSAPNPVLSTIKHFRSEYEAHIRDKLCIAGICPELTMFEIDSKLCTGCTLCKRVCPVDAISGELKKAHEIDKELCISCGACRIPCRVDAIKVTTKIAAKGGNAV